MFIHTLNIAQLLLAPNETTRLLDEMVNVIRFNQKWRAMKVVHGDGGSHQNSALKNVVRNWADRNKGYFKGIIPGETYTRLNPVLLEMQRVCGSFADADLGNSGITVIWVK
ncbi:MAG: hypothetical protein EHM64_13875 [Ignavibacteriae bacterium]|nr:MAG: hypothetical protein EHM64_13875 [Ignavibacteriota bacterium]